MQISGLRSSGFQPISVGTASVPSATPSPLPEKPVDPVDDVQISSAALKAFSDSQTSTQTDDSDSEELSEEEQKQVSDLKERDAEVRAHEAAHAATGGRFAGSPSFEYQVGPDGKRYAIGGEVSIDTSPIDGNPQATIDKLRQVQAAALAPAEPSDQDRKVAQQAAAKLREAEAELSAEKQAELRGETPTEPGEPVDPLVQQQVQQAAAAYEKVAALV